MKKLSLSVLPLTVMPKPFPFLISALKTLPLLTEEISLLTLALDSFRLVYVCSENMMSVDNLRIVEDLSTVSLLT